VDNFHKPTNLVEGLTKDLMLLRYGVSVKSSLSFLHGHVTGQLGAFFRTSCLTLDEYMLLNKLATNAYNHAYIDLNQR
jgi:hypothetical protein